MFDDMECPYCGHGFEYDDCEPKAEDEIDECQCPECEKMFVFTRNYSISYYVNKADCLNGSPHNFKQGCRAPTVIYGKIKWLCADCGTVENRDSKCQHGGSYCDICRE